MDGRTTIVIAHRAGTIALADTVVLLDQGRVIASGRHQELLDTEPRYRDVLAAMEAAEAESRDGDDSADVSVTAPRGGGG
jgi:ATP-binding cassette, subfamily B, bacterial